MLSIEFVVPTDKHEILKAKLPRLKELFNSVKITLAEVYGENQWIRAVGEHEHLNKAKEYIQGLCKPETIEKIKMSHEMIETFCQQRADLERDFGIVIDIDEEANCLIMQGTYLAVTMATSKLEQKEVTAVSNQAINPVLKEFALKLGYDENQVQSIAKKFGPDVDQNKLLQELIHTSASSRATTKTRPSGDYNSELTGSPMTYRNVVARGAPTPPTNIETTCGIPAMIPRMEADPEVTFSLSRGIEDAPRDGLRPVVIDGSNVAMSHGNQRVFSCRGIALCVDWFRQRGHNEITVFVPRYRTEAPRPGNPVEDQQILLALAQQSIVKFTPSRRINGRNIVCYDDRFILELAVKCDGVVVSNDHFRDLMRENDAWREVIETRLLMYSFAGDYFMPPEDPLGRHGPTLDEFLRKGSSHTPKVCPFLGRCTFGPRCRFYHPDRDPTKRPQLKRQTSKSDPDLSQLRASSTPPPRDHFQNTLKTSSLDRQRSYSESILQGPIHYHGNSDSRYPVVDQYNGLYVCNQGNEQHLVYPSNGYYGYPGYAMYAPVMTEQHYSYTPSNTRYTTSGSLEGVGAGEGESTRVGEGSIAEKEKKQKASDGAGEMEEKLKAFFPGEESRIAKTVRDNPELCRKRDVNALSNLLLDLA